MHSSDIEFSFQKREAQKHGTKDQHDSHSGNDQILLLGKCCKKNDSPFIIN